MMKIKKNTLPFIFQDSTVIGVAAVSLSKDPDIDPLVYGICG